MIAFDYYCPKCQYVEEIWHASDKKRRIKCPKCSRAFLKKLMTSGGFTVKGFNADNGYSYGDPVKEDNGGES